jgi:nucleotide-binding universal stress UspA family protein
MPTTSFLRPSTAPLICGVDFSEPSRRALALAATLAHRLAHPLTVVTVVEALLAEAADIRFGPGYLTAEAARDLQAFVTTTLPADSPPPGLTVRALVGQPARTLLEVAAADAAVAVVVGTQGLGWIGRLWFGSTTRRLLHAAAVPVLAVPPGETAALAERGTVGSLGFARVLCGMDFGPASIAAARVSVDLGAQLGLPVRLVHAVAPFQVPEPWLAVATQVTDDRLAHARRHLQSAAASLGLPASATGTRQGDPANVLVEEASSDEPALIVLGLEPSGSHAYAGATASRVVSITHTPVLAVPPEQGAQT